MKFFTHANLPPDAVEFVRLLRPSLEIETYVSAYPEGADAREWLSCLGKQAEPPVILSVDDGIKSNAIGLLDMQKSGCGFIFLARRWQKFPWNAFVGNLLIVWPAIEAAAASMQQQKCKIEISINGKPRRINF